MKKMWLELGISSESACSVAVLDLNYLFSRLLWQDACYDVSWSEASENVLLVATGNGGVVIWDIAQPQVTTIQGVYPIIFLCAQECLLQGHSAEVSSVEWDLSRQHHHVISSSWDHTIRLVVDALHLNIVYLSLSGTSPSNPVCQCYLVILK